MAKERSLMNLAKGNGKKNQTNTAKKPVVVKEVEKPITPAEERDLKAKAKVEELLQDVPMTLEDKKEELLEMVEEEPKGVEWLEEQVQLLADSNVNLKAELELARGDYQRLLVENQRLKEGGSLGSIEGQVAQNVVRVFNELQGNYFQHGENFIIYPVAFMNRLIMFFPFLQNEKRF
jgi:hypothetical protein